MVEIFYSLNVYLITLHLTPGLPLALMEGQVFLDVTFISYYCTDPFKMKRQKESHFLSPTFEVFMLSRHIQNSLRSSFVIIEIHSQLCEAIGISRYDIYLFQMLNESDHTLFLMPYSVFNNDSQVYFRLLAASQFHEGDKLPLFADSITMVIKLVGTVTIF